MKGRSLKLRCGQGGCQTELPAGLRASGQTVVVQLEKVCHSEAQFYGARNLLLPAKADSSPAKDAGSE
jgi:hypothetical protein